MISHPRAKGNRSRRKAIIKLERQGYLVDVVEKTGMWVRCKDLYNCFDLMAIQPMETKLIQVKSNKKGDITKIQEFAKKYPQFKCEVWIFKDWRRGENNLKIIEC